MTGPPEFRDLYGDDVPDEDRARLEQVHELLVAAGPPPELPPSLAEAPDRFLRSPSWLPRRRLGAVFALAAAIAMVAFLGGFLAGYQKNNFDPTRVVAMQGTSAAPSAHGLIKLGKVDAGGNWPMLVEVRGLPRLPKSGYYELFLTRNGKPLLPCGGFNVETGTTTLKFSVPYTLGPSDGWVVTRWEPGKRGPGLVLLRT